MFRPIVYKPLWDTFVFRFEFYETVSFLSSLEVLLKTIDPYLWISDSKWRIFLTYLGISFKWRDFLPFRKNPQSTSSFFPLFVLGFIPIFVLDEFHPKSETILHHNVLASVETTTSNVLDPAGIFFSDYTKHFWILENSEILMLLCGHYSSFLDSY